MPPIDPDAPWWANVLLVLIVSLVVAIVPSFYAVRAKRESKKAADVAVAAHDESSNKLDRVLHNVENDHPIGLRDDLDRQVSRLAEILDVVVERLSDTAAELRGARTDISHMHNDVSGLRSAVRSNRSRTTALERMLSDVLDQAQELIDHNHPGVVLKGDLPPDSGE